MYEAPALASRRPPSPCVKVCSLDEQGYCAGCLRTLEEIARWSALSAAEQWQVIAAIERRKVFLKR
ncbi:MAG: DUF1289 domain-containing protein [Steroidobacteraceae bacterium]